MTELRERLREAARVEYEALPESNKNAYKLANKLAKEEAEHIDKMCKRLYS
jgi:hypothetical protein